jgi:hypothetical protein
MLRALVTKIGVKNSMVREKVEQLFKEISFVIGVHPIFLGTLILLLGCFFEAKYLKNWNSLGFAHKGFIISHFYAALMMTIVVILMLTGVIKY